MFHPRIFGEYIKYAGYDINNMIGETHFFIPGAQSKSRVFLNKKHQVQQSSVKDVVQYQRHNTQISIYLYNIDINQNWNYTFVIHPYLHHLKIL